AVSMLGWSREQTYALSLGCTSPPFKVDQARSRSLGNLYWASRIADVFMSGQASAALGAAQHLLGKDRVIRISPVVPEGRYSLDGAEAVWSLRGLGQTEARKALPDLSKVFFQEPADPFTPCRTLPGPAQGAGAA